MFTLFTNDGRLIQNGVILLENLKANGFVKYLYIKNDGWHISNGELHYIASLGLPLYDGRSV